jgi:hypothetical protein
MHVNICKAAHAFDTTNYNPALTLFIPKTLLVRQRTFGDRSKFGVMNDLNIRLAVSGRN